MNKVEYIALKKAAKTQYGADDADTLIYYADAIEKQSKIYKWVSIFFGIMSIPLIFIIIGIPILILSIALYIFGYRRTVKKAKMFKEHVNNDKELSVV